jgi:hypothetical protein
MCMLTNGGIDPLNINLWNRWESSASRTGRLSPAESPHYPLHKLLGEPQSWCECVGEERNLFLCLESNDFFNRPTSFKVTVTIAVISAVVHRKITILRITEKWNKMMLAGFIWLKVEVAVCCDQHNKQ